MSHFLLKEIMFSIFKDVNAWKIIGREMQDSFPLSFLGFSEFSHLHLASWCVGQRKQGTRENVPASPLASLCAGPGIDHTRLVTTLPRGCRPLRCSGAVNTGEEGAGSRDRDSEGHLPPRGWSSAPEKFLPVGVSLRAQYGAWHTAQAHSFAHLFNPCLLSTLSYKAWGCKEGVKTTQGWPSWGLHFSGRGSYS